MFKTVNFRLLIEMGVQQHISSCDVCIIGAGISGLTLAYRLQKAGLRVKLLEKSSRPGGVMQTDLSDGFLFDQGPSGTFFKSAAVDQLIDDLGLQNRVQFADEDVAKRYIVKDGKLHSVSMKPLTFLRSGLLSWRGKLRLSMEPFLRSKTDDSRESVADFVRRRLGQETLERLIDPLIAGIYAGDPEQLDFQYTLPRLAALERQHGSLIRGMLAMRSVRRKSSADGISRSKMFSFDGGMNVLAATLARELGDDVVLNAKAHSLHKSEHAIEVSYRQSSGNTSVLNAAKVVLATPAHICASLLAPIYLEMANTLKSIDYSPVAVVFHGYARKQIRQDLDGFGFLVPGIENRRILGSIWSSSKFSGRAPDGYAALTTFVGGRRQPELLENDEDRLLDIAESELRDLMGISGQAVVRKIRILPKAIPQFGLQYKTVLETVAAFNTEQQQIRITGNFLQGVGVADCIKNATEMAKEIVGEHRAARNTQQARREISQAFSSPTTARI